MASTASWRLKYEEPCLAASWPCLGPRLRLICPPKLLSSMPCSHSTIVTGQPGLGHASPTSNKVFFSRVLQL